MWFTIFVVIVVMVGLAIYSNHNSTSNDTDYIEPEIAPTEAQVNAQPTKADIKISSAEEDLINLVVKELSPKLIKKLWDICQNPYSNSDDLNIITICHIRVFQYGICANINSTHDDSSIDFAYPFAIHQVSEIHSFEKACSISQKISDRISYETAMLWQFYDGVYEDEERNWTNGNPYDCITSKAYVIKNLAKEQMPD
ncbi:MAG: hypothetical protein IJE14_11000 [Clostridia bacterium]|nr:hypothetical protein [Clostridia bacterium]